MLKFGIKFEHIEWMNPAKWLILYKVIVKEEERQLEVLVNILKTILGVELKKGMFTPLSTFINPEMVDKILGIESYGQPEEQALTEEEVIEIIEELDGKSK